MLAIFGEVDCRCHLIRQKRLQQRSSQNIVHECVQRHLEALKELNQTYRVCAYGPIASSVLPESNHKDFPRVGSTEERNEISLLYNQELEWMCRENNVGFVTLFYELCNLNSLQTKEEFYAQDRVHLSQSTIERYQKMILDAFQNMEPGFMMGDTFTPVPPTRLASDPCL